MKNTSVNMGKEDITRMLISNEYIHNNLRSLFPDSVLIDQDFQIAGLGSIIESSLGYTFDEIQGRPISHLEEDDLLIPAIRERLEKGFFCGLRATLKKKFGGVVNYEISGFYLGLMSDLNGIILLRLSNQKEISALDQQLQLSRAQLDNFVYRAAHDLRGPLATIQGLTNLFRLRKNDPEVDSLVDMIVAHAEKMDERLNQLAYVAQAGEVEDEIRFRLTSHEIETHLRRVLEQNTFLDFLELDFKSSNSFWSGINEVLLKRVLSNLVLYFLSLRRNMAECKMLITVTDTDSTLVIKLTGEGFEGSAPLDRDFNFQEASLYTNLFKNPRMTYLFAAQKIVLKLSGVLTTTFEKDHRWGFVFVVPVQGTSPVNHSSPIALPGTTL